jgi:hypothetical protein
VEHFRPLGQKNVKNTCLKTFGTTNQKIQQIVVTNDTKEQRGLTLRTFSPYSYDEE